ncbi:MAG TPA: flagellar hook-length control protein FliK [Bradyrhizobium sp.]|nr:flagellar hook-length control protein FliK [Bradyrhizobium sp.]
MSISVNTSLPVIAAQGVAPELVLQPGTVINAQVLKVLSNDLVQIAISNLALDVLTEVPLSAGQSLQLAVSQTSDGIRLAVVGQGSNAAVATSLSGDSVTLAPGAVVTATNSPASAVEPPTIQLTPPEQAAVAAAAENAATQQASLAPLFANLGVVAASNGVPPQLRQVILQLLAQRTNLDQNLTGGDVKNAFQKSGILLEAQLASGSASPAAGIPDLKAALIVLRQTLLSSLGTGNGPAPPAAVAQPPIAARQPLAPQQSAPPQQQSLPLQQQPVSPSQPVPPEIPSAPAADPVIDVASQADAAPSPHAAATPAPAPPLSPEIDVHEILLPQARLPVAEDPSEADSPARIVLPATLLNAAPRAATVGEVLNLLQEALQQTSGTIAKASLPTLALQTARKDDVTVHTNTPPPPIRGAQPSTQPIALPSIAPDALLATSVRHLLDDTDAALARQTLLQVASLPGTIDTTQARHDPSALQWNFEIPFATPQGTAVTQFEISRDGGGSETEAAKRIWRARFSIDLEPAGPVHALISLSGERTSVRMWAERPATVAQLRAGAAELSHALSQAELVPGDIVIRDGTPPQSAPARAGHFLDRAL